MCFRLKSCCGCHTVEKGSTIIAILGMVFGGLGILSSAIKMDYGGVFSNGLNVAFSYMLYHGVKYRNPCMVLAYMVLQMISVVVTGIAIVALFVLAIMVTGIPEQDYDKVAEQLKESAAPFFQNMTREEIIDFVGMLAPILWSVTALVVILFVITIYLWSVVYSFYKEMKEELRGGMVLAEEGNGGKAGPAYNNLDQPPPYTMKS